MNIKLPFGIRDNKIIHISEITEIERGLNCNCTCPQCGQRLIAKLGEKNIRHFAHNNDICKNALETALHKYAKEILQKHMKIKLPNLIIEHDQCFRILRDSSNNYDFYDDDLVEDISYYFGDTEIKKISIVKSFLLEFDRIELEQKIGDVVPDIIVYKNNTYLMIEVAVTHFVDEVKKEKIKKMGISTIEINLNIADIDYVNFDKSKIEDIIINEIKNKKWIYNKKEELKKQELHVKNIKVLEDIKQKKDRANLIREKQLKHKIEMYKKLEQESEKILREYDERLDENWLWIEISKRLKLSKNNLPKQLNLKVSGELVFKCDNRIWQAYIYEKFILKRKWKLIYTFNVVRWVKDHSILPINAELKYTKDIKVFDIPDLTDVILNYLTKLSDYGILEKSPGKNNFYTSFLVLNDSLFPKDIKEEELLDRKNNFMNQFEFKNKVKPNKNNKVVYDKTGICEVCGIETSDWIIFNGENNTCICRECRLNNKG